MRGQSRSSFASCAFPKNGTTAGEALPALFSAASFVRTSVKYIKNICAYIIFVETRGLTTQAVPAQSVQFMQSLVWVFNVLVCALLTYSLTQVTSSTVCWLRICLQRLPGMDGLALPLPDHSNWRVRLEWEDWPIRNEVMPTCR